MTPPERPSIRFLQAFARRLSLMVVFLLLGTALSAAYVFASTRTDLGLVRWAPCGGWTDAASVVAVWISVLAPLVAALPPVVVLWRGGRPRAALQALAWSLGALVLVWLVFNQTQPTC